MSDASILKEFLVALGFKVDDSSIKKLEAGIARATKVVTSLAVEAEAMAATVGAAVVKVSQQFEDLYYASQRIGASVEDIRAFAFGIGQMGGSADQAKASLENMAEFIRSNPGAGRFLQGLGIQLHYANGQAQITNEVMSQLGAKLRSMPYYQAKIVAGMFGIDTRTLQAILRGPDAQEDRFHRMAQQMGIDQDKAAKSSHDFMNDLRDLLALMTLTADKLMLAIQPVVHVVVEALVAAHGATHGWSTALLELAAAIGGAMAGLKFLGVALPDLAGVFGALMEGAGALATFLSGPIGWIAALVAILGAALLSSRKFRDGVADAMAPLAPAFREVGDAFAQVWAALQPIFDGLGSALLQARDAFADSFGPVVIDLVKGGVSILLAMIHGVAGALQLIADVLRGDWQKAWNDVISADIRMINDLIAAARHGRDALLALWNFATGRHDGQPTAAPKPAANDNRIPAVPAAAVNAAQQAATNLRGAGAQVAKFFQGHGFSPAAAAGIAAGVGAESRFNEGAVNPKSGAFGIGQWLGARKAELFRRYGSHPTLAQQLEFMFWEMTHTEARAGGAIRSAGSAQGALDAYIRSFMRPGPGAAGDLARGTAYLSAQLNRAALTPAPTVVQMSQKTDIHVHGGDDPHATGREVANQQERVNGQMVRNLKTAAS